MENQIIFKNPIFKYLPEDEKETFLKEVDFRTKKFYKGEYIAYQGESISYLYIIVKGKVKTEMVSDAGVILHIEELYAPAPLAAAFMFAEKNIFPVDVIAIEETEIMFIKKEDVEILLQKNLNFLKGFLEFNSNRSLFLSERLRIFSQKGIKGKFAYYILRKSKNNEFILDLNISNLAEYFSVTRPSLSRAIAEMITDGIIDYSNGKGKILNIEMLKQIMNQ